MRTHQAAFAVLWVTVAVITIYLKFIDEKFVFKKVRSSMDVVRK